MIPGSGVSHGLGIQKIRGHTVEEGPGEDETKDIVHAWGQQMEETGGAFTDVFRRRASTFEEDNQGSGEECAECKEQETREVCEAEDSSSRACEDGDEELDAEDSGQVRL